MKRPVVLFGNGNYASTISYYLKHDSEFEVVAFTVDADYIVEREKHGLPVVDFETVEQRYPPAEFDIMIAVGFINNNRLRHDCFYQAKEKGYRLPSYIASTASTWNIAVGENTLILDRAIIHPYVEIGANTIIGTGSFIGHHSRIGKHCFLSAQVAVAGSVTVDDFCFLGINSTVSNHVHLGEGCTVGAGSTVIHDIPDEKTVAGVPARELTKAHDP